MVPFPTVMATTTQGCHLQLVYDLKITNTFLEASKESLTKPPLFRREEAVGANYHLHQGSPAPMIQVEDTAIQAGAIRKKRLAANVHSSSTDYTSPKTILSFPSIS